jgi:hypothetical protein
MRFAKVSLFKAGYWLVRLGWSLFFNFDKSENTHFDGIR